MYVTNGHFNYYISSFLGGNQFKCILCLLSPMRLALEVVSTGAVVTGTLLVPGQHVHQQVGMAQTGLPLLWFGITHWKQQLWRKIIMEVFNFCHFITANINCCHTQTKNIKPISYTEAQFSQTLRLVSDKSIFPWMSPFSLVLVFLDHIWRV